MDVEGIRQAHEQVEQRTVVDRFGNLLVAPADPPQTVNLVIGNPIGVSGQRADESQQGALCLADRHLLERRAVTNGLRRRRKLLALQLQEPRVRAQSIVTPVQRRHIRGDHLVLSSRQRAIREVHAGGRVDREHEVRAEAHRAQNVGDTPALRGSANLRERIRDGAGRVAVLNPLDARHGLARRRRRREWHKVIRADALQIEKCRRGLARVSHQVRSSGAHGVGLARRQLDRLDRLAQNEPHPPLQDVKRVLDVGVAVPRDLLRRRDLQFSDAKSRPFGVAVTALDFVQVRGVSYCVHAPIFTVAATIVPLMFVYVGAITSVYNEPKPPLYERPAPLPREGNMGEDRVGITVFDLDAHSGELRHVQDVRGLRNPTYLATHPRHRLLYTAERETTTWGPIEAFAGQITTLAIATDGTLTVKDRLPMGGGATYVSTAPDGSYLLAALPGTAVSDGVSHSR